MPKDPRYKSVKSLIEAGGVKYLKDIFLYIPKKVVYVDMGINYVRFQRLINAPAKFTLEELHQMSELLEVDNKLIIELAWSQMMSSGTKGKRKK